LKGEASITITTVSLLLILRRESVSPGNSIR
jgi:hypothetical protein